MFDEFVKKITKEIELKENRGRARGDDTKVHFECAVKFLISELWRNSLSYPPRESSVNLRNRYYSELPRYRDENLTYRQIKAAFEGMITCRMIEETTAGSFWRKVGSGKVTRFIPTDKLLEKFENLEGHPAFQLKSDTSADIIILRNKINGIRQKVGYLDTPKTDSFRSKMSLKQTSLSNEKLSSNVLLSSMRKETQGLMLLLETIASTVSGMIGILCGYIHGVRVDGSFISLVGLVK